MVAALALKKWPLRDFTYLVRRRSSLLRFPDFRFDVKMISHPLEEVQAIPPFFTVPTNHQFDGRLMLNGILGILCSGGMARHA